MNATTWLRSEWDRVAGFTLVALGALFLILGYLGVKDTPFVAEELSYIASGGLGGLFCLGLGVGLHDEWRKLDRIESIMRGQPLPDPAALLDRLRKGQAVDPPAKNGNGDARGSGPLISHGPAKAGGALAVALDWTGARFRRALALTGVALVVPAAMLATGWRKANTTGDYRSPPRGSASPCSACASRSWSSGSTPCGCGRAWPDARLISSAPTSWPARP